MPVRNESLHVEAAIAAAADQTYPSDSYEVIVAVAPSRDGTEARVRSAAATIGRMRVLTNTRRTASAGLNLAIQSARGQLIVRIDARTIVARDYIEQCVEALERSGADNVGGPMIATGNSAFGRATALAMGSWLGSGGARFRRPSGDELVDTVYLGAWRREYLLGLGGFDETLDRNQDDELNMRIRRRGGRILLTTRIRSTYVCRDAPGALWRQYFDYGVWKVPVLRKHADAEPPMWEWRHLAPPAFVVACVAGAALPAVLHLAVGTLMALIARADWRTRAWLPPALLIIPLAYGTGMLAGVVRSWRGRLPEATSAAPLVHSLRARRLETTYDGYRRSEAASPRWRQDNAGNRAMRGELSDAIRPALASLGPIDSLRVLDVGTGLGTGAAQLIELGVSARHLFAVDLLEARLASAGANLPGVRLQRADAVEGLPFSNDAFDIACAFTLFSSIERDDERRRAAREIARVVRPGGLVLVYDSRLPNPLNRRVRAVSRRDLTACWPGLVATHSRSLTLLPPLARRLGSHTQGWYARLARVSPLRTHTFAVFTKPSRSAAADAA